MRDSQPEGTGNMSHICINIKLRPRKPVIRSRLPSSRSPWMVPLDPHECLERSWLRTELFLVCLGTGLAESCFTRCVYKNKDGEGSVFKLRAVSQGNHWDTDFICIVPGAHWLCFCFWGLCSKNLQIMWHVEKVVRFQSHAKRKVMKEEVEVFHLIWRKQEGKHGWFYEAK